MVRQPAISSDRLGAAAVIVSGVAGLTWFWLETAPARLGYTDTDSPGVMLRFVHDHPEAYDIAGLMLLVLGIALTVGVLATARALDGRVDALALQGATAFGLFSALFWFGHSAIRLSVAPMQHIQGLDQAWGEAAYVASQMIGVHVFAQLGVLTMCLWAVALSLIGSRTGALPRILCWLGVIPALRLIGILGPLNLVSGIDGLWLLFMATIPGTWLWVVALGSVLASRRRVAP